MFGRLKKSLRNLFQNLEPIEMNQDMDDEEFPEEIVVDAPLNLGEPAFG